MGKRNIDVIVKPLPKLSGAELIAVERRRQVEEEGWTPQHDDQWKRSELIDAALAYLNVTSRDLDYMPRYWPWAEFWWKPKDPMRNFIKAGALIAAEIDRLQRIVEKKKNPPHAYRQVLDFSVECPHCNRPMILITSDDRGLPTFHLCTCRTVINIVQDGVGEVPSFARMTSEPKP